ncbi:MAG: TldD/PmbA family protein [Coriobacteriia bacterium]|jgi:TldD protein|nr:TldD/PmbA family protein [Coriobacteriia bacterium]
MRDVVFAAINAALVKGARYADARVVDTREEQISIADGRVDAIGSGESFGIGVRVIADGSWGFAASAEVSVESAERLGRRAVEVARSSANVAGAPINLTDVDRYETTWTGPCEIDPFEVSLEDKIDLLLAADRAMRSESAVKLTKSSLGFHRVHKYFASSEESYIEQSYVESGAGISALAISDGEVLTRSYPNSFGGNWLQGGFEIIRGFDLVSHAPRVAEEAAALLTAAPCASGTTDLIIDSSQLGLQIHESIGHPTELDRVLGDEAAFAGTSFLGIPDLSRLKYGSEHVTVTADATVPGSIGSFGFDDEGVPAQRDHIITEGTLTGFLTSRESARSIMRTSNGCMRADGWNRIPLIRMTTVSLEPGEWSLDDLIADTDDGLYVETNNSWSIDDKRLNFQFACEIGWEIKNGKRTRMVKNPNYTGITPQFWNSCDAVCSRDHWQVWGLPNCGKGEPIQIAHVAHGASPARFRNVQVGVGR